MRLDSKTKGIISSGIFLKFSAEFYYFLCLVKYWNMSCILSIPSSCFCQVAPSGDRRHFETLSDGFGPERTHALPGWGQHRVLPHLRGLRIWLSARGGGRADTRNLCGWAQLPTASAQSSGSALHLHQRLERPAGHLGEGTRVEPGAAGGQEEEAAGVVRRLSSADEGEVHRGH